MAEESQDTGAVHGPQERPKAGRKGVPPIEGLRSRVEGLEAVQAVHEQVLRGLVALWLAVVIVAGLALAYVRVRAG